MAKVCAFIKTWVFPYVSTFAQTAIVYTVYRCRPMKTNFRFLFPFAANQRKFAISINSVFRIYIYIYIIYVGIFIYINFPFDIHMYHILIFIYICCRFKWKMLAKAIFLNPFTICSSCKRNLSVCKTD